MGSATVPVAVFGVSPNTWPPNQKLKSRKLPGEVKADFTGQGKLKFKGKSWHADRPNQKAVQPAKSAKGRERQETWRRV